MRRRGFVPALTAVVLAVGWQLVAAPAASAATTWWVDGASSTCSNTGPGTDATPFCTISAGVARAVTAGDTVNVRPGTYAEQVTVAASGASGAPITLAATGPGVVVVGTRDLSGALWTATAGGTFSTPYAPPSAPKQVFLDGARLAAGTSATTLAAGSFFYDTVGKVLHVNLGGDSPSGRAVTAGAQTYGVNVVGRSNVVVDGIATTGQNAAGLRVSGSSAVTLRGVSSTLSGAYGVLVEASSTGVTVSAATVSTSASVGIRLSATTASTVTGSSVSRAGNHGVSVQGSAGATVELTESSDNAVSSGTATAAGIDVGSTSPDAVVRGNLVHGNQDSGIQVTGGSARALVVRNVSWGNGNHGFHLLGSTDVRFVSNTAHANRDDGLSVEGGSTGATVRNSVLVDNGLATARHDLYVEQASTVGFTADRDVLWNSRWVPAVRIGLTRYQTIAEFASATGQEAAGLGVDPQFVDAAGHDLRLSAQSAALDSADAGVPGFEAGDRAGTVPTDDPTVPDTGTGTPAFADRGALERVPQAGDAASNAPHAAVVLSTVAGQVPPAVSVTADARGSSDVDTDGIASYTVDFGDGTVVGPQPSPVATHAYTATGTRTVTVTVTDTGGLSSTATGVVVLTDRPLITYHVDAGAASCSDAADGTTTPFCSISRAAALALAGDTVVVEPGDYREQVTPTNTGMAGAPLTFRAHGAVRVLGTTDLSDTGLWSATATTAWRATVTAAVPVTQVFRGGTRLAAASSATTTSPGTFFYDAATSSLYVDAGGGNPASGTTLEASTRTYGFKLWKASTVVVDGFTVQGQNGVGVSVQDASDVTVNDVTARQASSYGVSADRSSRVRVTGATTTANGSIGIRLATSPDGVVTGSTSYANGYHGISLQSSTGGTVAGNVTHDNVHPTQRLATGIDVSLGSTGALVERNTTWNNQDSGIEIYSGSDDATVRRNVTHDNGDHGLDCLGSARERVVGNTVVGNTTAGINLEGGCSASVVADNVSVGNATGSPRTIGDIRLDELSSPGSSVHHNLVYQSTNVALYEWNSAPYTTVDAFRAASGQGDADVAAPPAFADEAGRDLALTLLSPAVDSADLGVPGVSVDDRDGVAPVDVPVVADTGAGSVGYADRGALEYHGSLVPVPPTAALSASPATGGHAPVTVQLSAAASTAGSAPLATYAFACGNGTTVAAQPGATASCTYASAGSYTATVTVTDTLGLTATATAGVDVAPPWSPPTASLTVTPATAVAPFTATLDASSSVDPAGGPLTYTFACGNGTSIGPQAAPTASCTYAKNGGFTASVTVTSSVSGLAGTTTKAVSAQVNKAPSAAIKLVSAPATVAPTTAGFDASGSKDPEGRPLTYTFTCGNGTTVGPQSGATATCAYPVGGSFKASVTVTDDAGNRATSSTITLTIAANQAPTASLRVTLSSPTAPTVGTLDASGSRDPEGRPLTYVYDCGTGTTVGPTTSATATCSYPTRGTWTARVTVTDDVGKSASASVRLRL